MSIAPEIPLDLRLLMHDCILALFWPKKQILEFLKSVGTPSTAMAEADTPMSRHDIVTDAFSRLSARPDKGYTVFQTMIDRLSNWTYFDPYYFTKLGKLNQAEAQTKIDAIKRALDTRNQTTERRRTAAAGAHARQKVSADLGALKTAFSKLYGREMTPQARGRLFETFLKHLFDRQSVAMGDPFNLNGEQIDGTFKFDGENYIVEAKWLDAGAATEDLYKFAHKVDGKLYGRGLFVSVNGFTGPSFKALVHGKALKTILVDGADLSFVLEERLSLEELLDRKIRAAQTRGEIYFCGLDAASKI
ncbi:hypothetical protein D3C73_324250 [compost metagenome]